VDAGHVVVSESRPRDLLLFSFRLPLSRRGRVMMRHHSKPGIFGLASSFAGSLLLSAFFSFADPLINRLLRRRTTRVGDGALHGLRRHYFVPRRRHLANSYVPGKTDRTFVKLLPNAHRGQTWVKTFGHRMYGRVARSGKFQNGVVGRSSGARRLPGIRSREKRHRPE